MIMICDPIYVQLGDDLNFGLYEGNSGSYFKMQPV